MDITKIKRFATEARNILMQGVIQRFITLGFNPDGTVNEEPEAHGGGATFRGGIVSMDFYNKWKSLQHAVNKKTIDEIAEEAAYTWFNRFVAIRIMAKNNLITPVLEYVSDEDRIPIIVSEARQGRMPQIEDQNVDKLKELLYNDAETSKQFNILIVSYCHDNPIINKCFGAISDYTELLLPTNILNDGGFIDTLNHTDYISDQDFHSPELIGWLYQFYISEKKDAVFASFKKKKKAEAKDIPAATQIFTPNWIVKYMVQNTVGRIYLDKNPYSDIKDDMQYLVENENSTDKANIYEFDDIHNLACADLACGSGHILNEIFDLLYKCYIEEGYNRRQAIEDIFRYNLTGLDLDTRAKQLSQFALLLKACQKDTCFVDGHSMPRVYDMPEPYADKEHLAANLSVFIMANNKEVIEELYDAIILMDEAQNLGSIMKFDISERARNMISVRLYEYDKENFLSDEIRGLMPYVRIILSLTHNYSALVMNPPYMGGGNMNAVLSKYVKDNYEMSKRDLYSVFIERGLQILQSKGYCGFVTMESWMFLSSFEKLRRYIIENSQITSLSHFGWHIMRIAFGTVSFTLQNIKPNSKLGEYSYLTINDMDKENDIPIVFPKKDNGRYAVISQKNFEKIPGCPIGYWVSEKVIEIFDCPDIGTFFPVRKGADTSDNNYFLRLWYELDFSKIGIRQKNSKVFSNQNFKWAPYNKGGVFRRWYGNNDIFVLWENEGEELLNSKGNLRSKHLYFKNSITWNALTSTKTTARFSDYGAIFDSAGSSMFPKENMMCYSLALMNSKCVEIILSVLNPTLNYGAGTVSKIPMNYHKNEILDSITINNIKYSRQDWDAHETSWDFQKNELIRLKNEGFYSKVLIENEQVVITLCELLLYYKMQWEANFNELHVNEEELNRQFIEIYGLQDELTPDVPLNEITILQQGEISIKNNELQWHDDVVIKQLISYAVGCMMGRYSIDCEGFILANQGEGIIEYEERVPNSRFKLNDDGIVPLMPSNTDFTDAATKRFKTWLSITFGEESLVENLNFVEKCLDKTLDQYFVKDFWKNHKKMYQDHPIYWLFRSKKGAFQCIVYMHRMNPYSVESIRTKYLLPHIEWLMNKQNEMQENYTSLSTIERKELDRIVKQIVECREYHDRLHVIADKQIDFDLDDGVVVNYAKFGDVLMRLK